MFWAITARQFAALLDRDEERRRAADRRVGKVVAVVYNANRDVKKDPHGKAWEDFFPEWKAPAPVQTDDQMYETMMMWAKATEPRRS